MEKYKVDKQGHLKVRDKKKIGHILHMIYDILSGLFIVLISIGLIVSCNNKSGGNEEEHIPNIQQKLKRSMNIDPYNDRYLTYEDIMSSCDIWKINYRKLATYPTPLTLDTPFYVMGYDSINGYQCYQCYKAVWSAVPDGSAYQLQFFCYQFQWVGVYYIYASDSTQFVDHYDANMDVIASGRYFVTPSNFDVTDNGNWAWRSLFEDSVKVYSSTTDNGFAYEQKFDNDFNYNALGQTGTIGYIDDFIIRNADTPFVDYLMANDTINKEIDYDVGYFVSGKGLYNRIRVTMLNSKEAKWVDYDGNIISSSAIGVNNYHLGAIISISYMDSYSGNTLQVWSRDSFYSGSNLVYNNSGTWLTDDYKTIHFIGDITHYYKTLFSNVNNGRTKDTNYTGNANLNDAFGLLGGAFTSIAPILNIQILPGISILLLMLIPLAITLIFAIVKLLRK